MGDGLETGRLRVSDLHELHWERHGAVDGLPAVVVHGGPGSGISPAASRILDPATWRIVSYDQRGCGRSTPLGETRENTTDDLVEDIERLREHLGVDRWMVFAGSWGTTLAFAYLERHPERCLGLLLRGVTEWSRRKYDWALAHRRFLAPEAWEGLTRGVADPGPEGLVAHYLARVSEGDAAAARIWKAWERRFEHPDLREPETRESDEVLLAATRIQLHYWANDGFATGVVAAAPPAGVPIVIVHGRLDFVCPVIFAVDAHRRLPGSELVVVEGAGHSLGDPTLAAVLREQAEKLAARIAASGRFPKRRGSMRPQPLART